MARFRYLGEPPRPWMVVTYGPSLEFRIRCSGATESSGVKILNPVPPATEFVVGEDIGYDITDDTMIRTMNADIRFEEIV
jgi:hypothetical protein